MSRKWEYAEFRDYKEGINELREAGKKGWEAFFVRSNNDGTYVFYCKREIADDISN